MRYGRKRNGRNGENVTVWVVSEESRGWYSITAKVRNIKIGRKELYLEDLEG